MPVRFECPHCKVRLRTSNPERLLKPVVCPSCKTEFQASVPEETQSAARVAALPAESGREDGDSELQFLIQESRLEEGGPAPQEQLFYKLDSTKVSLREYWWGSRFNPLVLVIASLVKLFRLQVPSSSDDPPVKSLGPFAVSAEEIPEEVRDEFRPLVVELQRVGFENPLCHVIRDGHHRTSIHWLSLRHESGRALVRCQRRHWHAPNRARKYLYPSFVTAFRDGTYLTSTSGKADMLWPPVVEMHRDRKADAAELWEQHCRLLDDKPVSKQIRGVRDRHELQELLEEYHQVVTRFHVDRGVFAKMSVAEDARARAAAPAETPLANRLREDLAYSDVYDELQRQLTKKQSWLFFLLLLGVSMVLFAMLGTIAWSAETALLLIPVLLFHEAGHYVAMKLSGYQNVKMFFIPLLGAAVSAQSLSVPNWKKVLVSLAGPVPGIVLGIALGIVGMVHQLDWLKGLSMMLVVVNGVNLAPVLPFDGGWVVHALLFSRHYALDVTFRVLAGLAMLFVSALTRGGFLAAIGVFLLIGARTTYKLGKIARSLEPTLKPMLEHEETLSRQTVNVIAREIDESFKQQSMTIKVRAELTKNVFEMIKCPAPGWLASFAFAGVYLGSMLAAVAFGAVLVLVQHTNLSDFANVALSAPTTRYQHGSTQVVEGPEARPTQNEVTLIAECADAGLANGLFAELKGQIPAAGTFRVFGQTLLLALPANDDDARKQWSTKLEPRCESVVVESDLFSAPMTVVCIAPDVDSAEAIEQDFNDYATARQFKSLVSPWSTDPRLSPEQRRARKTLRLLTRNAKLAEDNLNSTLAYLRKRTEALRRGEKDAVARIDAEHKAHHKKRQEEHIQSIRSLDDVDPEVIEIYTRQPVMEGAAGDDEVGKGALESATKARTEFNQAYSAWCDEMAPHLGQLPAADGEPGTRADRYGTKTGYASHAGLLLRFDVVQFNRPVDGVASFAEWLYSQNCVDVKYRTGNDNPSALSE